MPPALLFHRLFGAVSARQVEYSYGDETDGFTSMVPLDAALLPRVQELAAGIDFAGQWAWSVGQFARRVNPDAFLLRLDWENDEPTAATLYCRFPSPPDAEGFETALAAARPFAWAGPDPRAIATALGAPGCRGIAFRVKHGGALRTSLYFKCDQHANALWADRLRALLDVCRHPGEHASVIEAHLRDLYGPGPVGILGINDGAAGVAGAVKFNPSDVPLSKAIRFIASAGAAVERIASLTRAAQGLRARLVSYVGVQYDLGGLLGWRLYFSCEPGAMPGPLHTPICAQRTLRPVVRLPHY